MNTSVDTSTNKMIFRIATFAVSSIFCLSSCAMTHSRHQNDKWYSPLSETCAVPSDFNKTVDKWEKARAAYLRDLEYARIDRQHDKQGEYKLKSGLIETRYHFKTSETAMFVEHDYPKALEELKTADVALIHALGLAKSNELNGLRATRLNLGKLVKMEELSLHNGCALPQTEGYRRVEANIEKLIADL